MAGGDRRQTVSGRLADQCGGQQEDGRELHNERLFIDIAGISSWFLLLLLLLLILSNIAGPWALYTQLCLSVLSSVSVQNPRA
jgi:hypothetical protein